MLNGTSRVKTAIVHEWLVDYSGSERVLEQILNIFPDADLFAIVEFLPEEIRGFIKHKPVRTSFIQHLPFARKGYRNYLPLMPLAVEQFDMGEYDMVISSSHAVSKGVLTGPDQLHISYVHSPIRYAWDLQHEYLKESGLGRGPRGWIARWILHRLRIWDLRTAHGVDAFVANSQFIARRIRKVYRRDAEVVYPPVNVNRMTLKEEKDDFYVTASRMVPYKRIDLIVEAFSGMPDKRLVVIGSGPQFKKAKSKAAGNVTFLGFQPFDVLKDYMQRAKAFVFAAEEDFGILPVEAQACGTPVIAYGKGGALETVNDLDSDAPTGVFFKSQTVPAIIDAVERFEKASGEIAPSICRDNALRFSEERFRREFSGVVERELGAFANSILGPDR